MTPPPSERPPERGAEDDASGAIDGWKPLALALGASAEGAIDRVRRRFAERFRPDRRLHVVAYRGFGNRVSGTLSGRVLVYREPPDGEPDSLWRTLQRSYRRFETDEVPGVLVRATVDGEAPIETRSDGEGYFTVEVSVPDGFDGTALPVRLALPEHDDALVAGSAAIALPGPEARLGVISDIDDTVLVTEATSLLKMMRLTLLESSESRVAFPGVAAFYAALHAGRNPFFYVSSSPWNLYEFLEDFMSLKGIVAGPMLLRDFGLDRDKLVAGPHKDHKLGAIRSVLERQRELPFVLIGDSGQHDPEIYARIVEEYPARILAVYIRDVSGDVRDRAVGDIAARLEAAGVDLVLVPDTLAAARHAASRGWLDEAALDGIRADVGDELAPHVALDEQQA